MNSAHGSSRRAIRARSTYIIEAMVMLACVVAVAAVTMTLFSYSAAATAHADRQQHAMVLAANAAERFAADPEAAYAAGPLVQQEEGGYQVSCETSASRTDAGYMYSAAITVRCGEEQLWDFEMSRYVNDREGGLQ